MFRLQNRPISRPKSLVLAKMHPSYMILNEFSVEANCVLPYSSYSIFYYVLDDIDGGRTGVSLNSFFRTPTKLSYNSVR